MTVAVPCALACGQTSKPPLLFTLVSFLPQLALAKVCANGQQLGLDAKASAEIVSQLFQASQAVSKQQVFAVQKGLNDTMR